MLRVASLQMPIHAKTANKQCGDVHICDNTLSAKLAQPTDRTVDELTVGVHSSYWVCWCPGNITMATKLKADWSSRWNPFRDILSLSCAKSGADSSLCAICVSAVGGMCEEDEE